MKLKFSPKIAEFISEIIWHPSQKLEFCDDDGSLMAYYEVMGLDEIKRWVLSFGADVEVIEPAKLREDILKEVKDISNIYQ